MNVVIGANGMVGRALMEHMSDAVGTYRNNRDNLVPDRRYEYLDIRSASHVYFLLEQHKPKKVFIASADANVNRCEEKNTDSTNIDGVKLIINNCYRLGIQVVFFSSSYVFDGKSQVPYKPHDETSPINAYGRQKEVIEKFLTGMADEMSWLIIRTVGVFGKEGAVKNFVAQVKSAVENDRKIIVPTDQTMNPINAMDLARITMKISERYNNDIFHVAGNECMTKYEFAIKVAYKLGYKKPHDLIVGVKSDEMNQLALRPENGCLDCKHLSMYAIKAPSFQKGLNKYLG